MSWVKKSLVNKVLGTVGIGIALLTLVAVIFVQLFSGQIHQFEQLLAQDIAQERQINHLTTKFKKQVQEWKNVLLRGEDDGQRQKYWGRFQALEDEIQDEASALLASLNGGTGSAELRAFIKAHKEMSAGYQRGFDQFVASGFNHRAGDRAVQGIDRAPTKLLEDGAALIAEEVEKRSIANVEAADTVVSAGLPLVLLSTLLVLACIYLLLRWSFTQRILSLETQVAAYGQGDFSDPVAISGRDELYEMATSINQVADFVRNFMEQVSFTSGELSESSIKLSNASEDIRKNTTESNDHIEGTAAAVSEMTATAQEVSANAESAAISARAADDSAKEGFAVMENTISTIHTMSDEVKVASEVIRKLEVDTNSVGTVLEVIRGIAEQTNLLALNAAIEAARAGEQGRGFAVVADEVRGLAQRTQESTSEIQQIIESVQSGAKNAVSAMEQGRSRTDQCVEQARSAGESLSQITQAVNQILDMNNHIASAARQQNSAAEDINHSIHELSSITGQTRELTESYIRAASDLQDNSDQLTRLAQQIKVK